MGNTLCSRAAIANPALLQEAGAQGLFKTLNHTTEPYKRMRENKRKQLFTI